LPQQPSSEAQARAEAKFTKQQTRQREGEVALAAYKAETRAVDERTARLRAARLAKEAKEAQQQEEARQVSEASAREAAAAFVAKRGAAKAAPKPRAKKKPAA
jgi:uncharacterized protein YgbK (DUF1537 family)